MMLQDTNIHSSTPTHAPKSTNNRSFIESTKKGSPATTADNESMRGRKRDRSMNRLHVRPVRCAPSDECSTLRGRSRRRATSPSVSRTSSPVVKSPTNHQRLLQVRLRREHCPSRVTSPNDQQRTFRRRQRTRSRSRPGPHMELESPRSLKEGLSGLRNEVLAGSDGDVGEKDDM